MKKLALILFLITGLSWAAVCIPSIFALGRLQPLPNPDQAGSLPLPLSGMALTGLRVYGSLGCVACHTQQIRQLSTTSADVTRLWGRRGSLMRDALSQPVYFAGSLRIGPDLSSYALRQQSPAAVHQLLYTSNGGRMPPYRFLYQIRKIQGEKSLRALDLPDRFCPPVGYEVIPSYAAECLVAYLLSLQPTGLPSDPRKP